MKLRLPILFIIIALILISLSPFFTAQTYAGELSRTMLKLDRQKANTDTGGMVCAETPNTDNGAEARVSVIFPSGFTVNSNAANWTVSTSNLPSGASAWPGIGTAISVSGRTVTFPSSNLTQATYYCFRFSGNDTLTTGNAGNDRTGTVITQTAASSNIDLNTFGVSIVSNDQISVSATVPADPDDFETRLSIDNNQEAYRQNSTLYFTLDYRSNLSHATSITVEAEWSLGTYEGTSVPSIEILKYDTGTATNAYNNTPVIVDTVNRKIYWEISSFPGNTERTVRFQLKTTGNHTGVETVYFDVSSRILGPGTQSADATVTKKYIYDYNPPSFPGATATPNPTTAPPSEPEEEDVPEFSGIDLNSASQDGAGFTITTSKPTTLIVDYGTSPGNLNQRINFLTPSTSHKITFDGLDADQNYYFRVTIIDEDGNRNISDIYSFKTASDSDAPKVNYATLVFFTNNNLFTFSPEDLAAGLNPFIVIPENSEYQFRFALEKGNTATRIKAILRPKDVLGAESDRKVNESEVELSEVETDIFLGNFASLPESGLYELFIQIYDLSGNVIEQKLADTRIVRPFRILSKSNRRPIENAIVRMFIFNTDLKTFSLIPASILGGKNPVNTHYNGIVPAVFSAGRYRAEINALGYKAQTVDFRIGPGKGETYPEVLLEAEQFNVVNFTAYYLGTILDVYIQTLDYVNDLSLSLRFFDLVAALSMFLFVATVIFSMSLRTHIRVSHLPLFFLYNVRDLFGFSRQNFIHGQITEGGHKAVTRAKISLFDAKSGNLLAQTHSNKLGEFFMKKPPADLYKVVLEKSGYRTISIPDFLPGALDGTLKFTIETNEEASKPTLSRLIAGGFENITGFLFEFLLINSVILEIIFIRTQGLTKTLPFIIVTALTLIVWLFYAKRILRRAFSRG